jgi:(2Fe-2S) ferredoxin
MPINFKKHVFVCVSGTECPTQGSQEVCQALRTYVAQNNLKEQIRINKAGCLGQCGNGPVVVVYPEATWYSHVSVNDCAEIVESHLIGNQPVQRLLYE